MKTTVIILIVFIAGIFGYSQFVKKDTKNNTVPNQTVATSSDETDSTKIIDLSNKGLSELQKDILDNKTVTFLNVSHNKLTGSLPAEIRKLTNLETLDASSNQMTGIPAEIGQLSKLRVANFANNSLTGLPLEIGNLKKLETLDLRGNLNISKNDINKIQAQIPYAKILTD